jgi:hypothetical protein
MHEGFTGAFPPISLMVGDFWDAPIATTAAWGMEQTAGVLAAHGGEGAGQGAVMCALGAGLGGGAWAACRHRHIAAPMLQAGRVWGA